MNNHKGLQNKAYLIEIHEKEKNKDLLEGIPAEGESEEALRMSHNMIVVGRTCLQVVISSWFMFAVLSEGGEAEAEMRTSA